jgi:methyl-accepting chemotaxis protein
MKMSIGKRLAAIVGLCAAALAVSAGLFLHALEKVKVTGPLYAEIVEAKDLVADILPPPEYIVESYSSSRSWDNSAPSRARSQ